MTITRTSTPTQVVSMQEAKSFFRILHDDEDDVIERVIAVAQERAVEITNRVLAQASYRADMDSLDTVLIPLSPFVGVDSATYLSTDGSYKQLPYTTVIDHHDRATLSFEHPVDAAGAAVLLFTAGYSVAPEVVRHYILTEALTLFEVRENVVIGVSVSTETESRHRRLLDSVRVVPV